jgi:hypothetical protein
MPPLAADAGESPSPSTAGVVVGGSRWYRARLLVAGPAIALVPPLVLGITALVVLRVGSGRLSAVIGLLSGVVAAPGLLVIGAPIADESSYPMAIVISVGFWALLGFIAARRAVRRPFATWYDFWLQFSFLAIAAAVGAIVGLVIAAARIGETLL